MKLVWLSLALALAAGAPETRAHSFYSQYCCNGQDCQPVRTEAVQITAKGYLVTLRPQDHIMLLNEPAPRTYLVPFRDAKPSPDGAYHVCIYPGPDHLRCFYAPPHGS